MASGNFSNAGRDTFDPLKQYVGIRLQQGVPLLDRDWNELEDIRRYFERMLRDNYIGEGVPDHQSFRIMAPSFPAPGDFLISAGRCSVDGYDAWNAADLLYSQQHGIDPLPAPDQDDLLHVYLQADVVRVSSAEDADLRNAQDVNLETCVRDKLVWSVRVARHPAPTPPGVYPLADITRPQGKTTITADMIKDLRRTRLNLATALDRVGHLEAEAVNLGKRLQAVQLDVDKLKQQVARMFWDVNLSAMPQNSHFGASSMITANVVNGLGEPVAGAVLSFSTDWGVLDPNVAVTGADGQATVQLTGVYAESPPSRGEISVLQKAVSKIPAATLERGAIQYNMLRFEPQEMSMLSRYSHPSTLVDLSANLPAAPIVSIPASRTATVTIHAREGQAAVVRGIGSVQVRFGMWLRDWAMTKMVEVISKVQVGVRVGDVLRQGIDATHNLSYPAVVDKLPVLMQTIHDDTHRTFRASVLSDANTPEEDLARAGTLGQVIAQESTAAIGAQTAQAVAQHLVQLQAENPATIDAAKAKEAQTHITQAAAQISAGFAQAHKQRFNSTQMSR